MAYIYYKYKGSISEISCDENLHTKIIYPFTENLHALIWRIVSFLLGGSYCKWQLIRGSKILSEAEVVSWLPVFKFMPRKGIHIGPCHTVADERGKGYYPYLLRQIVKSNTDKDYYMIVEQSNTASIRGVLKAGFVEIGGGIKTRSGQYVMVKDELH